LTINTGMVLGTPLYMAPEQWQSTSVGPPADVWSVGVLLYELLSGTHPYTGENVVQVAYMVQKGGHIPLYQRAERVPRSVSDVVDRMLGHSPADRFSDGAEARAALRAAARQQPSAFLDVSSILPRLQPVTPLPPEGVIPVTPDADRLLRFQRACDG